MFEGHKTLSAAGEIPDAHLKSFRCMNELIDKLESELINASSWHPMQDALRRALMFLLSSVAWSEVVRQHFKKAENFAVVSRWKPFHSYIQSIDASAEYEILDTEPKSKTIAQLLLMIFDSFTYALKCVKNAFVLPEGRFQGARVGFYRFYDSPLDHVQKIQEHLGGENVYVHIAPVSTAGQVVIGTPDEIHDIDRQGWDWWFYKDRHAGRAWKALARDLAWTVYTCMIPRQLGLRIIIRKTLILLRRIAWELEDTFTDSGIEILNNSEENSPRGPLIAGVARKLDRKTLCAFAGFVHPNRPKLRPPNFDAWTLWGSFQKEMFENQGVPPENIFLTGHLKDEHWIKIQKKSHDTNPSKETLTLLYFSQPTRDFSPDSRSEIAQILKSVLKKNSNTNLIVKPHPAEDTRVLEKLFSDTKRSRIVDSKSDSTDWISKAAIVVGANSTALLEALAMEKPLAVYDKLQHTNDYVSAGAAIDLLNADDPVTKLLSTIQNPERLVTMQKATKGVLDRHLGILDGGAHKRIAGVLRELLSK